ncbi:MAG: SprT family zinc-dependent metalloprotease [Kiritimatiellae bacterium]|jgi:predicted metal-dependent hydrolase|nr:SprT family zinc-dependent metalloprotease [Kiritimatiellia bacterium]
MLKQFTYNNIAFDYHLIQEKRRTMVIEVQPDQAVIVKAPLHIEEGKIQAFLQLKLRWILKNQRRYAHFKPMVPKQYTNGETFRYLGNDYILQVQDVAYNERVNIIGDKLTVFSRRPHSTLYTKKMINTWYEREADRVFEERFKLCAIRFKLSNLPRLTIRRMKSRLGSYSTSTHRVCLTLDLIKVSLAQIDYIIIHELCHITHHGHGKDFYDLLSNYLPEWEKLEAELESSLLQG